MKTMKKLLALLLALTMVFALATTALAADGDPVDPPLEPAEGTITLKNVHFGETYNLYKMLDLTWDGKDAYTYTVNEAWADFFADAVYEEGVDGEQYIVTDEGDGRILFDMDSTFTYVTGIKEGNSPETVAKIAIKWAEEHNITPVKTHTAANVPEDWDGESFDKDVTWTDLDLGYYVLSTTSGTLCNLDTQTRHLDVYDKNELPKVEKTVKEAEAYQKNNTAGINDVVEFNTDITAQPGAQAYVLRDRMSQGLTFEELVSVMVGSEELVAFDPDAEPAMGDADWQYRFNMGDATIADDVEDAYNFTIEFNQLYLDTIEKTTTISVKYTATVNADAKIYYSLDDEANWNKTDLTYGDHSTTLPSETETKVYKLNVFKFAEIDDKKVPLEGAEFVLYKDVKQSDDSYLRHYLIAAAEDDQVWRVTGWTDGVATDAEVPATATTFTTDETGFIYIEGLDAGEYMLKETKAPEGYNLPDDDFKADIAENGTSGSSLDEGIATTEVPNAIQIKNESGKKLPETGGIGTTLFYVIGSVMMIGAAVLLVAKKRTSI